MNKAKLFQIMISSMTNVLQKNKLKLIGVLILLAPIATQACDICGCFFGITPYDNQSSISWLYRYRSYNGYAGQHHHFFPGNLSGFSPSSPLMLNGFTHGELGSPLMHSTAGSEQNQSDYELYKTMELRAKFFIHPRIELNAFIPYNMNENSFSGEKTKVSGIGDMNIMAAYHLIRNIETAGAQQRLILGAGLKLPTGNYKAQAADGDRIDYLTQTGTGSLDYFMYLTYMVGYKKFGASINTSYKISGNNAYGESLANGSSNYLNLFYTFAHKADWKFIPSIQCFYEYSKGELLDNQLLDEHKTNALLIGPGLDIYYKNIALNAGVQFTANDHKTGHPESAGKFHLGITYNFNQRKYLIK